MPILQDSLYKREMAVMRMEQSGEKLIRYCISNRTCILRSTKIPSSSVEEVHSSAEGICCHRQMILDHSFCGARALFVGDCSTICSAEIAVQVDPRPVALQASKQASARLGFVLQLQQYKEQSCISLEHPPASRTSNWYSSTFHQC